MNDIYYIFGVLLTNVMRLNINYTKDTCGLPTVPDGYTYVKLDLLRQFLLTHYPELCQQNFIKAIKTPAGLLFTYDWEYIFHVAGNTSIIFEFCTLHKITIKL